MMTIEIQKSNNYNIEFEYRTMELRGSENNNSKNLVELL